MQSVNLCYTTSFMCPLHCVQNIVTTIVIVIFIQSSIVQHMFSNTVDRQNNQGQQMCVKSLRCVNLKRCGYDKHPKKCNLIKKKSICWHRHYYRRVHPFLNNNINNNLLLDMTMTTDMQVIMMGKLRTVFLFERAEWRDMCELMCLHDCLLVECYFIYSGGWN